MATKVADLFALFGIKVDKTSVDKVDKTMRDSTGRLRDQFGKFVDEGKGGLKGLAGSFDGLAGVAKKVMAGVALYFGGRAAGGALIGFNANVEDAKNQIAGMLALTKKTDLTDQLKNADQLYSNLQRRAMTLPGTTTDYINMLQMITRPLTNAGAGLQELEDITVQATVAARAFHVPWEVAARDISDAMGGRLKSTDMFNKIVLDEKFDSEEGRRKFNALSKQQKLKEFQKGLGRKQIKQLGEAQGATFSGVWSTFKDTIEQTLGKIGKPLFERIGALLRNMNEWAQANAASLEQVGSVISDVLVFAFDTLRTAVEVVIAVVGALVEVFQWFAEHGDLTLSIVIALMTVMLIKLALMAKAWWATGKAAMKAWIAMLGPWAALAAAIAAVVYVVVKLIKHAEEIRDGFKAAVDAIAGFFSDLWEGIKDGARATWDWIKENVPLVGRAVDAAESFKQSWKGVQQAVGNAVKADQVQEEMAREAARAPATVPQFTPANRAGAAGPLSQVNTGDINFNISGAADPNAVAAAVDERLKHTFKSTAEDLGLPDRTGVA